MAKILKQVIILIIVLWLLSNFVYWRGVSKVVDKKGEDIAFVVSDGEGAKIIALKFIRTEFNKIKVLVRNLYWRKDLATSLQAGEYILNPNMSIKKISENIVAGRALSKEKEIKIIEGWTSREISQYFEREGMFQSEELLELVGFPKIDYRYNKEMSSPKN